jgi:hypothetical protein
LTPDGTETVAVFEGTTAEGLQRQIERAGLVTTVGNGMWLGRELARVEAENNIGALLRWGGQ